MPHHSREPEAGAEPLSPLDQRRRIIGVAIRNARNAIRKEYTDHAPNQAEFYKGYLQPTAAQILPKEAAARLFRTDSPRSRGWVGLVENGQIGLKAGQARVFEKVFGWPDKVLDAPFATAEELARLIKFGLPRTQSPEPAAVPGPGKSLRRHHVVADGLSSLIGPKGAVPSRGELASRIDADVRLLAARRPSGRAALGPVPRRR